MKGITMRKFLFAALMLFSVAAFARVEVDTYGLSDAQKAQLIQHAEQLRSQSTDTFNVSKVDQWIDVSGKISDVIVQTAVKAGVAVNDFLKTPVGIMTAALIVFHYAGGPIIHVGVGLLILFVSLSFITWFVRRNTGTTVTYDETKEPNWFGKRPIKKIERERLSGDEFTVVCIGYVLTFAVSLITMFAGW